MAFTLTFLGTSTKYRPQKPKPNDINEVFYAPRGETLSYIHSRIADEHGSNHPAYHISNHPAYHIQEAEVDEEDLVNIQPIDESYRTAFLLEGPNVLGDNLYDIIGAGVYQTILAIIRGEQTINITGHSRGAVESILASHELNRIKNALQNNPSPESADALVDLLCDSNCPTLTDKAKEGLRKHFAAGKEQLFERFDVLKNGIQNVRVNVFAVDPVPGGNVHGIPAGQCLDDRYYKVPPIVQEYKQIILENERSRGFKPIVPQVEDPSATTRFSLINLPGHHGSATGGPLDHNKNSIQTLGASAEASTREVQDVAMYLLYDFMSQHGVAFDRNTRAPLDGYEVNALDTLFETYATDPASQTAIKLATYKKILENREEYARFNLTHYGTGCEGDIQALLGIPRPTSRPIHFHNRADTALSSVIPFQSKAFVNAHHATIYLEHLFGRPPEANPAKHLISIIEQVHANPHMLDTVLQDDTDGTIKTEIRSSMQTLLSEVVQRYLRNSLPEAEKTDSIRAINLAFAFSKGSDTSLATLAPVLKNHLVDNLFTNVRNLVQSNFKDLSVLTFALDEEHPEEYFKSTRAESESDTELSLFEFTLEKAAQFDELKEHIETLADKIENDSAYQATLKQEAKRLGFYREALCYFYAKAVANSRIKLPKNKEPFRKEIKALAKKLSHTQKNEPTFQDTDTAYSTFIKVLSGFSIALGAVATALAITALILSTTGLLAPSLLLATGVSLAAVGIFSLVNQNDNASCHDKVTQTDLAP